MGRRHRHVQYEKYEKENKNKKRKRKNGDSDDDSDDDDDSDVDSDISEEEFPSLTKKEKKMAKDILSQPVQAPVMKSIAEIAREKLKKLEQMVHPAKPDPGSKKIKNGQVLIRKQSKAKRLLIGQIRRLRKRLKRKGRYDEMREIMEEEKRLTKLEPRTLESTREADETTVQENDEEVEQEEALDAFADYYNKAYEPRILVTSSDNPHKATVSFIRDLCRVIPNAEPKWRNRASIKKTVKNAKANGFTDLIFINEDRRMPNGLLLIHLPEGPTALFRVSNTRMGKSVAKKHYIGDTDHRPEVILNNFTTRLGRVVGRMLGAIFHYDPEFKGRRVCTLHNQRDYIFFRHHRYEFRNQQKVSLKEMGPRFTLRLQWLQQGAFEGDFEWNLKRHDMETSRRRFFL